VSALWGLWHLPLGSLKPLWLVVVQALVIQCAIGVPLSFAWRRSGNLALPAAAHGFADAVRDAVSAA
jgi:membrane protease YdiL (CAAX protease family)